MSFGKMSCHKSQVRGRRKMGCFMYLPPDWSSRAVSSFADCDPFSKSEMNHTFNFKTQEKIARVPPLPITMYWPGQGLWTHWTDVSLAPSFSLLSFPHVHAQTLSLLWKPYSCLIMICSPFTFFSA